MPGSFSTWPVSTADDPRAGRDGPPPHQLPHARDARRARGLAAHAAGVHRGLRLEDLGVAHREDHAVGLADRAHRAVVRGGVADPDRGGHRLGLDPVARAEALLEAPRERGRSRRLHRGEPGHPVDQSPLARLPQRLSEGGGVPQVARREHDPVRRTPGELLEQLEHDRLLALEPERVDGVEQVDAQPLARLLHQPETVVEAARGPGASARRRRATAPASRWPRSRGHQHQGGEARLRRIRGERGRGVAGGGAGHGARADPKGLGDADRHAPVLERAGRVVTLVLEQQPFGAAPAGPAPRGGERRVPLGMGDDLLRRREDDLAESPDARRRRARSPAAPLGEPQQQLGCGQVGRTVRDLQQTAAAGAARVGIGLGQLVAAGDADLPARRVARSGTSSRPAPRGSPSRRRGLPGSRARCSSAPPAR